MELADFIQIRPYAYHLTDCENLARIKASGQLRPAAHFLDPTALTERCPVMTPVRVDRDTVWVRDQHPLKAGNCALEPGFTFQDLVKLLNQFVYFWPGTKTGPIKSGKNHFTRYVDQRASVVLRIPTEDLFAANPDLIPHAFEFNSGAPRCNPKRPGYKFPRGPHTFLPFPAFPHTPSKAIELTFNAPVTLPWNAVEVSTPDRWINPS